MDEPPVALRGEPVAADIRDDVRRRVDDLQRSGVRPTLGTVLVSDDDAAHGFMDRKHEACAAVGIESRDCRLPVDATASSIHRTIAELCHDDAIHAVFVQVPLPDHVSTGRVREQLDPCKDVDCFHPANLGRLVSGAPRFVPATTAAVQRLLDAYDIPVAGRDVVIVGRSTVIGKPLANRLLQKGESGDATVTVCHSRTTDLAEKTRQADVLVTACGVPGLIDGEMLSAGVVVVDVSVNRVPADEGADDAADGTADDATDGTADDATDDAVVGDVDAASAREKARALTPVPGGVGPVTLAALLQNVVLATERQTAGTTNH